MIKKIVNHIKAFGILDTFIWVFRIFCIKIQKTRNKSRDFMLRDLPRNIPNRIDKNNRVYVISENAYYHIDNEKVKLLVDTINMFGYKVYYFYTNKSDSRILNIEMNVCSHLPLSSFDLNLIQPGSIFLVQEKCINDSMIKKIKVLDVKIIPFKEKNISSNNFRSLNEYMVSYGNNAVIQSVIKAKKKSIFRDNLSIIVLNHNNMNVISNCIDSLIKYNINYNYEIIVVDNDSTDGSYKELEKKYMEKIKLIKNKINGCSSGRNMGVDSAKGEYILFLDSDQFVINERWLEPYENVLSNDKSAGLIGWTAGFLNTKCFSYMTVDNFPYRYIYPEVLARGDISYLGSGGMLIKRGLFLKIGGFDVNYDPTCYEDTDLSLKVRNAGYKIYYCPYLGIVHFPHQTTKEGSGLHTKLMNKNRAYFKDKWKKINPSLLKKYRK